MPNYIFYAFDHPSRPTRQHLFADCPAGAGMGVGEVLTAEEGKLPVCKRCLKTASRRTERGHHS